MDFNHRGATLIRDLTIQLKTITLALERGVAVSASGSCAVRLNIMIISCNLHLYWLRRKELRIVKDWHSALGALRD